MPGLGQRSECCLHTLEQIDVFRDCKNSPDMLLRSWHWLVALNL